MPYCKVQVLFHSARCLSNDTTMASGEHVVCEACEFIPDSVSKDAKEMSEKTAAIQHVANHETESRASPVWNRAG